MLHMNRPQHWRHQPSGTDVGKSTPSAQHVLDSVQPTTEVGQCRVDLGERVRVDNPAGLRPGGANEHPFALARHDQAFVPQGTVSGGGNTARVGAQLRRMRFDRGLSLEVVAGLAGFSAGFLSRVERDQAVLDRLSHWRGLADALRVPLPSLLRLSVPALNEPPGGHRPAGSRIRKTGG